MDRGASWLGEKVPDCRADGIKNGELSGQSQCIEFGAQIVEAGGDANPASACGMGGGKVAAAIPEIANGIRLEREIAEDFPGKER